jgi:hypothetical protein
MKSSRLAHAGLQIANQSQPAGMPDLLPRLAGSDAPE